MKRLTLPFIILGILALPLLVAWQSDLITPRVELLESQNATQQSDIATLQTIAGLRPTWFPEPVSTPTQEIAYDLIQATNRNTVSVRIRANAGTNYAIIGEVKPGETITVCWQHQSRANGLTWLEVYTGGFVAIDFLELGNINQALSPAVSACD